jgi:hypothetical protein
VTANLSSDGRLKSSLGKGACTREPAALKCAQQDGSLVNGRSSPALISWVRFNCSTMSRRHSMTIFFGATVLILVAACSGERNRLATQNSLSQNTGEPGSTMSRTSPPYYPNSASNIVAPPGNPAGNRAGDPPIVGGNVNQSGGWPEGR